MYEVYKHEVAHGGGVISRNWRFYWEVDNQSGRQPSQIAQDLADELASINGWWFNFRIFWPPNARCHAYRFQRLLPDKSAWWDLYQEYRNDGRLLPYSVDTPQIKCNVNWVCEQQHRERGRTELDCINQEWLLNDTVHDGLLFGPSFWAELHVEPKQTAWGDTFWPTHLDADAQYKRIISYWLDRRQRTRRQNWRKS